MTSMVELLSRSEAKQTWLMSLVRALVETESPSGCAAGLERCADLVLDAAAEADGRGMRRKVGAGDFAVEVKFGRARNGSKPMLLLGHLDTVWPVGTLEKIPFRIANGRAYGPGVLDMKAGVAMALTAVQVAGDATGPVRLLLVGDEEVGSPRSRALTERVAGECDRVYVLEPAQGSRGAYKTARKGIGHYTVRVQGVAAHSGVDFWEGHSAVTELAQQIVTIAGFSDEARGVTVNAGVIGGGTAVNVTAAEAWAEIDVRVPRLTDAARVERRLRGLRVHDAACSITVEGGLNRPPMVRNRETARLFRQAQALAREIGVELEEAATGGGSDGNFTAALGIPTLDGMGAVGEGAHAAHESVVVSELARRTALLAGMLLPESEVKR